jgi:hypothetical protein
LIREPGACIAPTTGIGPVPQFACRTSGVRTGTLPVTAPALISPQRMLGNVDFGIIVMLGIS